MILHSTYISQLIYPDVSKTQLFIQLPAFWLFMQQFTQSFITSKLPKNSRQHQY